MQMINQQMERARAMFSSRDFEIRGKTIVLVPFGDIYLNDPNYLLWLRDYEIMKYIARPEYLKPISFKDVKSYVTQLNESKNDFFFAIETLEDRKFIGTFKIGHVDWYLSVADLGILIGDKSFWGRGLASLQTFSLGVNFCFNELGFHKLTCGTMALNKATKLVIEKTGFKEEGYFREQDVFEGKRVGHYHFGLLKSEYSLKDKKEYIIHKLKGARNNLIP